METQNADFTPYVEPYCNPKINGFYDIVSCPVCGGELGSVYFKEISGFRELSRDCTSCHKSFYLKPVTTVRLFAVD